MKQESSSIDIVRACPSDAHAIAEVHIASWRTTYRGNVDDVTLDRLSVANREKQWKMILEQGDASLSCWIAKQGVQVIGFADGGRARDLSHHFDAELYAIYILKEFSRRRIGSLLFYRVLSDCIEQGFLSMMTWVAEKNEHRAFYEALGGVLLPLCKTERFGTSDIVEVAYGWNDIRLLYKNISMTMI